MFSSFSRLAACQWTPHSFFFPLTWVQGNGVDSIDAYGYEEVCPEDEPVATAPLS